MASMRFMFILLVGCLNCVASDPTPEPPLKIRSYTGGWGKDSGSASMPTSRLDGLAPDQPKKTADLDKPVEASILAIGRSVEGIEEIKDRIIDVRVTNPNPYTIFFRGRQYKNNKTIMPGWNKLENGVWKPAGWDWCGTHVRDWEIEPNGMIKLMLYLHPELKAQQILGRFFKADEPSIQSDCVLYETK
jgi:hypothetical protein